MVALYEDGIFRGDAACAEHRDDLIESAERFRTGEEPTP